MGTGNQKISLKEKIMHLLPDENHEDAENYASYCMRLSLEKDRQGVLKNPWMQTKTAESLAQLFMRVKATGLVFDGKHITLQSTGISLDYIAYKNKMLIAYPESTIDLSVVLECDEFTAQNENGKLLYKHIIADPFKTADVKTIKGAFFVVKNKRGEFLTLLSKEDIAKHKNVAKTQMIWNAWFKEMVLKTAIKKGCKYHFDDIFEDLNAIDNESIDLERSVVYEVPEEEIKKVIKKIESFKSIKALQEYYLGLAPQFIKNGDVFEAYNAQKALCKATK